VNLVDNLTACRQGSDSCAKSQTTGYRWFTKCNAQCVAKILSPD